MAMELKKEGFAPGGGEVRVERREAPERVAPDVAEPVSVERPPVAEPLAQNLPKRMAPEAVAPAKDERLKEIEAVLSEDLGDFYNAMTPDKKVKFKKAGEQTAEKVRALLPKAKQEKAYALIKDWLRMIPGVNKFYLEQEAKLKTDKLFLLS
jgi:hypothetical protein